eukprot:scaffold19363_cov103-Isochrysis_galbana.AAC.4
MTPHRARPARVASCGDVRTPAPRSRVSASPSAPANRVHPPKPIKQKSYFGAAWRATVEAVQRWVCRRGGGRPPTGGHGQRAAAYSSAACSTLGAVARMDGWATATRLTAPSQSWSPA